MRSSNARLRQKSAFEQLVDVLVVNEFLLLERGNGGVGIQPFPHGEARSEKAESLQTGGARSGVDRLNYTNQRYS